MISQWQKPIHTLQIRFLNNNDSESLLTEKKTRIIPLVLVANNKNRISSLLQACSSIFSGLDILDAVRRSNETTEFEYKLLCI